jgi:hypothetical protein
VLPRYYPNDAQILKDAKRIASGFTTDALYSGAWDLLPWSWIIDWFTNFSDFLKSYSNTVPAQSQAVCIMTETRTDTVFTVTSLSKGMTGGGGSATLTDKSRVLSGGTVAGFIPLIGVDRLSILSALFVQRFKG